MKLILIAFLVACFSISGFSALPEIDLNQEWLELIESKAPDKPLAKPKSSRKVLVFTLMTGYKHWCTPHTTEMVRIIGEKSGAFEIVVSDDPYVFEKNSVRKYDVVVFNNNCAEREFRHLFRDAIDDLDEANRLKRNLLDHIARGHGFVALHGGIVAFNNSDDFIEMLGGAFDFHPPQQEVTCIPVDPEHPVSSAFSKGPLVHIDEPYFLNKAYFDFKFLPLLEMKLRKDGPVSPNRPSVDPSIKRYISWIKPYGEGRVFYCSPSHNAQSFEQPELLQFILNGIQYAAGDLDCDDTPLKK